ncbi:MAG: porphobilinogen synthase [Saprospiraceae bacterium]
MEKEIYPSTSRRLRSNAHIRSLVSPILLSHQSFILPIFVEENLNNPRPIKSMESVMVHNVDSILSFIEEGIKSGVSKFLLFPIPSEKKEVPDDFTFAIKVVSKIKSTFGNNIWLATDVCLCSYTTHGHCGIMDQSHTQVLNEPSVKLLASYSNMLAAAGADCLAPSDMMDGRVKAIRNSLAISGLDNKIIMSYSAKFSSQWYGPFRDACHSSPQGTILSDRKSYQLSPFNLEEAVQCAERDAVEGADILMVKPAGHYTDVISVVKQKTGKPVAAYHVSGEYSSIEIMAERGIIDRDKAHLEVWAALQRSGSDIIISYAAIHAKTWIEQYEY